MASLSPRHSLPLALLCTGVLSLQARAPRTLDHPITPVPSAQVDITDAFWTPRMEANRTVSIQHVFARSQGRGGGGPAQLIEAAAFMLAKRRDPALEQQVDGAIARQAALINARAENPDAGIRTSGVLRPPSPTTRRPARRRPLTRPSKRPAPWPTPTDPERRPTSPVTRAENRAH
jgi:hypothetical protein